jgi:hypothetical protein
VIWQDAALAAAGAIGGFVALVHGTLTQRHMVIPLHAHAAHDERISQAVTRLVAPLLQFTTFSWFLGGIALIAAALWAGEEARLAIGLFVASQYLFGAIANLWATRSFHPGWLLMAVALGLIAAGLA